MAELVRERGRLHARSVLRRVRPGRLVLLLLWAVLLLVGVTSVSSLTACKKKGDAVEDAVPEYPAVNESTTNLLLTWIDDKGDFHVEERASSVPAASRDVVKVRDPARDPLSGDRIFVTDLRNVAPDGSYPVKMVPGNEFEDIAVTRRAKHGIVLAPREAGAEPGAAGGTADGTDRPAVIIYGASWCGPCHQAADYLKKKGIPYVLHDIEQDSAAAREMKGKLTKAGVRGGSIPVIDVRGRILVGFDARAVDQALGTAL